MQDFPSNYQVLIVEADRVFSASLAMKFALRGHYAQFAQSGTEALQLAARFLPSVAILGTELPDMHAPELAVKLGALFPSCRIVFLCDRNLRSFDSELPGFRNREVLLKSVHPEVVYQELSQFGSNGWI